LAEKFNARLILFHVIPPSKTPGSQEPTPKPSGAAAAEDTVIGQYAWLQPLNQKISVEHRVGAGDSAKEILRMAQISNCDLIVMGTHGRTGFQRLLLGSVAEEVLRKAGCPVLAVKTLHDFPSSVREIQGDKPDQEKRVTLPIQSILHPTDYSPQSDYAFEIACMLAEKFAARLILLHVIAPSSLPLPGALRLNGGWGRLPVSPGGSFRSRFGPGKRSC